MGRRARTRLARAHGTAVARPATAVDVASPAVSRVAGAAVGLVEDGLDPPVLDRLAEITDQLSVLELERDQLVDQARLEGATWLDVGVALGVTRQSAQQRHGGRLRSGVVRG